MTDSASSRGRAVAVAVVLAATIVPAVAKDAPSNPLARYLEDLDVGPGVEHRLLVVHPILARPTPTKRTDVVSLGGLMTSDALAIGTLEKSPSPRVDLAAFAPGPTAILTGDVLRTDSSDFAVLHDVVLRDGKSVSAALVRVSRETPPGTKPVEPSMAGPVLPSAIRYLLLADAPAVDVRETCAKWADEVKLLGPRRSPAELATADMIKKRCADYRAAFAGVPKRAAAGGREIVGVATILEGAFASFETFADGPTFAAAWPRLLDGIAAEAAVAEARGKLLDDDLAESADPDRFLSDMKKRMLGAYGARPVEHAVKEEGRCVDFALDAALGRALVLGDDRVVHLAVITDPAHRAEKRPEPPPDPGADSRKARPTEEEKRLIDRRNGSSDPPPPTSK